MKILIFAGGAGTRLWPLSRKDSPKQLKKLFNSHSTLQLAVDRVEKDFGTHNIYISTNEKYTSEVKKQLPQIPNSNIIGEPEKRDLAAAIGFNFIRLRKLGYRGPIAILWSDHLMENPKDFIEVLKKGERLILENPKRLVFVGEHPRYPENNLGWIHVGKEINDGVFEFIEWKYRPPVEDCKKMFASGNWKWNPGYFIVDIDFVLELYEKLIPKMYKTLVEIENAIGTVNENEVLQKLYPNMESLHFDNAIVEKVPAKQAVVIDANMGWSDPGTLYALKEALTEKEKENFVKGLAYTYETQDSLIINEDKEKLVATLGLSGMVIINTEDVLLVVHKERVKEITELIRDLNKNKKLIKYT
ncbi:MAG: mannose-1-phosphate guanylyltransferase [Paludibacteraceae bacterium]|nr:mannose-1-phosphate guanylyltransferase [Paludibacteraceae bacterium]